MNTDHGIEILEFKLPAVNRKNLFISGIPYIPEEELVETLYNIFSKYGLIYGTQVYPYRGRATSDSATAQTNNGFYAFVTYYLAMSAKRAKDDLNNRITISGVECKISYATKKKEHTGDTDLNITHCQELANYFLGFNGWSTSIKLMEEDCNAIDDSTYKVKYVCVIRLELSQHDLFTEGMGAWEEVAITSEPATKAKAICKSKKLAYQRAIQNAFSKVILIVLSNGKVTAEVDTTRPELLLTKREIDEDNILKVNEVDISYDESQDGDQFRDDVMDDIDAANLHILHELEEEM